MLKKISLVFLLSTFIFSCSDKDVTVDAVDKNESKTASKPRSPESKASTSAGAFALVNTGCASEPTLYNAQSWHIPGSQQYETYTVNGVIAGSPFIIQTRRLTSVTPSNRYVTFGVIRLLSSSRSYMIRNIPLYVNNDGTVTPGNYFANAADSFIISSGNTTLYTGTQSHLPSNFYGTFPEFQTSGFYGGLSYPASNWFVKINSCSVYFDGCKRKMNLNYEIYVKESSGQYRQLFPSSFVGVAVD